MINYDYDRSGARTLLLTMLTPPCSADDFPLLAGLRSVLASSIQDDGFICPDVKSIEEIGFIDTGVVLKVTCGPLGKEVAWPERALRVVAYPEGDFTAARWRP